MSSRSFFLWATVLLSAGNLNGQVFLDENFDYPVATNVTNYGWTAFSSGGISPVQISATGLSYPGYVNSGMGLGMQLNRVSGEDVERFFGATSVTSLYMGFLLNVSAASSTGALLVNFYGNGGGSSNTAGLQVRSSGPGFQLGLGGGFAAPVYNFGQTYLLVVEYYNDGGNGFYYLYVDPVLNASKPGPTITYSHSGSPHSTIHTVRAYQNSTSSGGTAIVDGIRVSRQWCDIVGNCPITMPLPFVDYFDYSGGADLITWGWSTFYNSGPMPMVTDQGLSYPGFYNADAGADAVMLMGCCSSYGVNKLFTPVFGGTVYASFLINYSGGGGSSTDDANIGFYSSTGGAIYNEILGFYVGSGRARLRYGTGGAQNDQGPTLNMGTTYMIVLGYDIASDQYRLWVNPEVGSTSPPPDDASAVNTTNWNQIDGISIMNNGQNQMRIDRVVVATDWALAVALEPPANMPTNLLFSSVSTSSANVSYTNSISSPMNHIVFRGTGAPPTSAPIDDISYFVGQVVGDATVVQMGSNNFFDGGLSAGTTYYYNVHGFNFYTGGPALYRYGGLRQGVITTEPGGPPSLLVFANVQEGQMDVSFTPAPSGVTGYIVLRNTFLSGDLPQDGIAYPAGAMIGTSTVAYVGAGTSFTDGPLSPNTNYFYSVYSLAGSGTNTNYHSSALTSSQYTLDPEPPNQPTGLTFNTITTTSLNGDFADAVGADGYLVLRRLNTSPTEVPVDGTNYSVGNSIGASTVAAVVSTSNFSDFGLVSSSTYHYDIFSYNSNSSSLPNYKTTVPLEGSASTLFPQPAVQAFNLTFSAVTTSSITVNWNIGDGSHRTVLVRASSAVSVLPSDGTAYPANPDFTMGSPLGDGSKVVYSGTGTSVNVTGLTPGLIYHFRIFESNPSAANNQSNYLTSTAAGNPASRSTLLGEPTIQASNLSFISVQATSLTLNWINGNGASRIVIMDDAAVAFVPVDGTDYVANTNYSAGVDLGAGQKCVMNGALSSVAITGLTANTTYHFRIYEYNGAVLTANYYTATATNNPNSRITLVAEPTTQASNIVFTPATTSTLNFNWSNGNGAGRIVVAKQGAAVDSDPADGTTHTASLTFGSGTQIGSGNYVVFVGAGGGPITVTVPSPGTAYHFRVYEYNGTTIQTNYNVATATGNPANASTLASEPVTQATSIVFSAVTTTSVTLNWTSGSGGSRLVLAKAGSAVDSNPVDANNYTASTVFGSGTQLGTGNYAVYLNNGNSVTVTGLTPGTTYHFRVYELNGAPPTTNYNVNTATGNPASVGTLFAEPTTQASSVSFSLPLTNGFTIGWTNGNGGNRIVIVDDATITYTPTDGATVAANTNYAAGTDLGSGQKCVYNGSGNSVAITGLSANTTYYVRVYEYNGTASQINYLTSTATGNPAMRKTLFAEPASHAALFTALPASSSQNNLAFSAASTITNAAGFILLRRSDGADPTATGINDGTAPGSLPLTAGTTLVTTVTNTATIAYNDGGLASGIQFNYALIPYGYDGSNAETYNYRTAVTIPVANATTFVVEPSAQPTGMTFSTLAPTSFDVSFTPPGTAPAGYIAFRKTGSSPSTAIPVDGTTYTVGNNLGDGTIAYIGASPSFSESGLSASTLYFYDVFAFNGAAGLINYLNAGPLEGSQTTLANPPSNQPTSLAFTTVEDDSYNVSFTASAGGAAGYLAIRRSGTAPTGSPNDGSTYTVGDPIGDGTVVFVGAATGFAEAGLTSNTTYHYALFAYNGSGGATNYLTASPLTNSQLTLPQAPNALAASVLGQTSFTANWDAIAGITDFYIDVSADNFSSYATGYQDQLVTGTSVSATGLTPGTNYKYRLRAGNGTGQSVNSNERTALTVPATPTSSGPSVVTQSGFTAAWNAVGGVLNYYLDVATDISFNSSSLLTGFNNKELPSSTLSDAVGSLPSGTTYYYQVRAANASGTSASSTPVTVPTIPANPVIDIPTDNRTSTSFLITWSTITGATEYFLDVKDITTTPVFVPGYQNKSVTGTFHNVTGLTASTNYQVVLRSANSSGSSGDSNIKFTQTKDASGNEANPAPSVTLGASASTSAVTANVSGGTDPKTIVFFHRPIGLSGAPTGEPAVQVASGTYSVNLQSSYLDELGMEYYFEVTDLVGRKSTTPKGYVYQSLANEPVPNLASGGKGEHYRIFSIPVDLGGNNDIEDIFASVISQFQGYNKEKWRLVRWQSGRNVDYTEGLTRIDKGKGYWFNSTEAVDLDISGSVIPANQDTPFQLQLEDGWNQIGNPFTFDISWSDVLSENPSVTGVGPLYVYNPAIRFDQSDNLKAWGGGFVDSDGAATLTIPVTVARPTGRNGETETAPADLGEETWFIPLKLTQGTALNTISGIGMSPESQNGKDLNDELTLPRFVNYLEVNGHHPEYTKWPRFMKDVVTTADNYTWNLKVESNFEGPEITLSWDRSAFGGNDAQLVLFDEDAQVIVDMRVSDGYTFPNSPERDIKIIYARTAKDFRPGFTGAGQPYPNPFSAEVTVPLIVGGEHDAVTFSVYDMMGRKVSGGLTSGLPAGRHELRWDGKDFTGSKLADGVYVYRITFGDRSVRQGRIILSKN